MKKKKYTLLSICIVFLIKFGCSTENAESLQNKDAYKIEKVFEAVACQRKQINETSSINKIIIKKASVKEVRQYLKEVNVPIKIKEMDYWFVLINDDEDENTGKMYVFYDENMNLAYTDNCFLENKFSPFCKKFIVTGKLGTRGDHSNE